MMESKEGSLGREAQKDELMQKKQLYEKKINQLLQ